jgi:hypothetical protein
MSALAEAPTMLPAAARATLVERIPDAITRTAGAVVASTEASVWVAFAEWANDGRVTEEWAARYVGIVNAGQTQVYGASASLYADYIALSSAKPAIAPLLEPESAILVDLSDAWTASPPKRLYSHLAEGEDFVRAVDRAGRYASSLASLDVAWTQRGALRDVSRSNPGRVRGQRKTLGGGACGWCRVVADKRYSLDANVPTHAFDRCGAMPVVEGESIESTYEGDYRQVVKEPAVPSPQALEAERFRAIEGVAA